MDSNMQLTSYDNFTIIPNEKFIPIKECYLPNYTDVESYILHSSDKKDYFNLSSNKYYNRRKCYASNGNRFYEEVNLFYYDNPTGNVSSPTQNKNKWEKSKLPLNDYFKLCKIQKFIRTKILKIPKIVKLQSYFRGFLYRNKLREFSTINKVLEDRFNFLEELLKKRMKVWFLVNCNKDEEEPEQIDNEIKKVELNDLQEDDILRLKNDILNKTIKNHSSNLVNSFEILTSFDKKPKEYIPSRKISFEVEIFENERFILKGDKMPVFKDLKYHNTNSLMIEKNKKLEIFEIDNNVTIFLNELDTPTRNKLILDPSEIFNCCNMYIPSTPSNKYDSKFINTELFTIKSKGNNIWKDNLISKRENENTYFGVKKEPEVVYKEILIKKNPSMEFIWSHSDGFSYNPNINRDNNENHIQILTSSDDEIMDDDLSINNTAKTKFRKAEIKGDLAESLQNKNKLIRIRVKGKNENDEGLDEPLDTQGSYNRDRGILYESFIPKNKPIISSTIIEEDVKKEEASDNKQENFLEKELRSKDNYIQSERHSEISSMNKTSNVKFIPEKNIPDNKEDLEYRISYVPPRKSNYGKIIEREYSGTNEKDKEIKEKEKPDRKIIHEDEEFVGARSTAKILEARKLLRKSKQVSEKVIYREYRDKDIFVNERFKTENK